MPSPDLNAVKARIKQLEGQLELIQEELEELEIAEAALERLAGVNHRETRPLSAKDTVEELVLGALDRSKIAWLTVPELQKIIKDLSGRDVPMSTLSPQVSFMTNKKGSIVRSGSHVALPERANKEPRKDLPF